MAREKNIWKFNDDEWKVHVNKKEICDIDLKDFGHVKYRIGLV